MILIFILTSRIHKEYNVILTRAPLFVDKVDLMKQFSITFLVGIDTLSRITNPKYYDGSDGLHKMLLDFQQKGVSFLVVGRVEKPSEGVGKFLELKDLSLPQNFEHLFVGISEKEFRSDLSSTLIRKGKI